MVALDFKLDDVLDLVPPFEECIFANRDKLSKDGDPEKVFACLWVCMLMRSCELQSNFKLNVRFREVQSHGSHASHTTTGRVRFTDCRGCGHAVRDAS
jgi:hypothetical protein